jgi:glutamate-ammonia-ligase adenylyltransferase
VQLLQMVHGRNDESLHVASTVDALAALGSGGYVGRDDAANLTASYEFLRLLEHRLQLQRLKRTHMLPDEDDDEALRWLARAAHVRPDGRHDAQGVLREELKRQNMRVSRLHAKLFYQPLLESVGTVGISEGMTPEAAERQLAALGYEGVAGCSRCCCRRCWTGSPTRPIPMPAYWRTGGSARRSRSSAGICRRCATRARWPSG